VITIREYSFKRGFAPDKSRVLSVLKECFPCDIKTEGGGVDPLGTTPTASHREVKWVLSYGPIKKLTVQVDEGKKMMYVDTESDANASKDVIRDAISKFNLFLEKATGYTSKERRKKITEA